ncbi:hypothetical protein [Bosea sp. (in: a-proteobacteria)]|uniref:hypothetical protein n=1 Tax=Bosea sp. (in: a-proteobacteria) TaxID=1871050 RepID=UPI002FC90C79
MTAEASRNNGYVSLMSGLKARLIGFLQLPQGRKVALDERFEPEGLSAHMARDLGLNDASLVYDSRRSDREP